MQMFPDLLARPIQTVSNVVKLSPNTSVNKKLKDSVTNMTKYIKVKFIFLYFYNKKSCTYILNTIFFFIKVINHF